MIQRTFVFGVLAAITATACSAAPNDTTTESGATSEEALMPCPVVGSCVPPLPVDVTGTWSRQAGTIAETLELHADHTYSLVETSTPVCVRFPCTAPTTLIARTEGTYAQSATVIKLAPVTPNPLLPEGFDILRRILPMAEIASDPSLIPLPVAPIELHAVEGGQDIYLTKTTKQDCPTGTLKCNQCGAYPPGGVCTTFVCLRPTQRCLPVP